ncbi:MAG: hydroxyethylthiazole kinase [Pseudomonadota bacterium]
MAERTQHRHAGGWGEGGGAMVPGASLRGGPVSAGDHLAAMRQATPRIHLVTAPGAVAFQANALLAAGGIPVTVDTREEVTEIAEATAALVIDTAAINGQVLDAMLWAAEGARGAGHPWVLDPGGAGATGHRRQPVAALLARRPTAVLGGAAEILALASIGVPEGRSAALVGAEVAEAAAADLARRLGSVVAVTGEIDFVTDGVDAVLVPGGHALMGRVHAMGAGLSAVAAAFLATGARPFPAVASALAFHGVAGREAASAALGPGSFAAAFLDALALIGPDKLDSEARLMPA